jgi:hypothetical protein
MLVQWQSVPGNGNAGRASIDPNAYAPGGQPGESGELLSLEDYWFTRISYPTGKVDTRWLLQAAKQDKLVRNSVPGGKQTYKPGPQGPNGPSSPLSLSATSWTSLGPKPLQSTGCQGCYAYGHVSGRVNDIEVDPVVTTTAYIAPVGGGIWKTTNCCTASTVWFPTTDDPLLNTTSVDDISIDPNDHNTIYVGTGDLNFGSFSMGSVGVYKSTDGGGTWSVKGADVFSPAYPNAGNGFPQYNAIGKVEADPNDSDIVVAGTKTGVFLSYDGGDNWSGPCFTNNFATQRQDVTGLILSDSGSLTTMYVAVGARGYSTTVQSNLAENGANGIYMATVPASGCPAGWNSISTFGNGWPNGSSSGIPQYLPGGNQLGRIDMAIAPSDANTLYAVVQAINAPATRGAPLGVWRTTDGGVNWVQRAGPGTTAASTEWAGCDGTGAQSWYNQHIEVDPNNSDVVLVDTIDIFKSTNGADTFTNISCGYTQNTTKNVHVDQHALEYVPGSSTIMLAGNDGGVYVSRNMTATPPTSISFTQLNDSLNTIEFYSGDITANFAYSTTPGINAGAQDNGSGVYKWSSNNVGPAMWQLERGGDGMFARIEPVTEQRWYQESQNGNLFVSVTGPFGTYEPAAGGWVAPNGLAVIDRLSFVFPYEIYKYDCPPTGCNHLIAGSYRVWESITGGITPASWYPNSPDLTKNTLADRSFINQLSFAVSMSSTAIVGTNDGNVQYGFNLGLGPDTATWVNVTDNNVALPNRPILDVTTDPVDSLMGYAAVGGFDQNTPSTPGHVFRVQCSIGCLIHPWENKTGNLPNIPVDTIMVNPRYRQQVFVGTDWGFYFTDNIDAPSPVWYRFNNGMPNVMIWDMSIDRGFTTLAVFTRGRGAYAWPLPTGPLGGPVATPTVTETFTATETSTATETATATEIPSSTSTPTEGPSETASETSTATAIIPTSTPTEEKETAVPTSTPTEEIKETAAPTSTATTVADTATPTASATDTAVPSSTSTTTAPASATGTSSATSQAATATLVSSSTSTRTATSVASSTRTATAIPSATTTATSAPTACTIQFQDVPPSDEVSSFYPYVRCLACRGILGGYPCGSTNSQTGQSEPCGATNNPYFRPSNNITRAQIAKIVSNAAGFDEAVEGQTYADVPPSDEPSSFYVYVERLTAHNVMGGYPCGTRDGETCDGQNRAYFRPSAYATRAQLAKIVSNAAGFVDNVQGQTFTDVPPSDEPSSFYLYVERLVKRGVMGGYPCGGENEDCDDQDRPYFRPSNNVTRAQAAKIVANTFFPNCQTPGRAK